MVTPKLEELMFEGRAEYKSFAMGGSGVGTIPFPKGARYMVVTDFVWFPFQDKPFQEADDPSITNNNLIHTMTFYNGKLKSVFNFRDVVANTFFRVDDAATRMPIFTSPFQYNCYMMSKQDIAVNIFKFGPQDLVATTFDAVPITPSQEETAPNGYGGIEAVRLTNSVLGAKIVAMGRDRDPGAAAPPPDQRERYEFFDDINAGTRLDRPTIGQYCFPLVNFGVVMVYDKPLSNFP